MRTAMRRSVLVVAVAAAVLQAPLVGVGTANAGVVCAAEYDGVKVYDAPRPDARVVNTLSPGPEYGCGSTSNPDFARVARLDDGNLVGYAYWNVMGDGAAG